MPDRRHIIAVRSWPHPLTFTNKKGRFEPKPGFRETDNASMTIADAHKAMAAGLLDIMTGRDTVNGCVVETLYAIPRKHTRPADLKVGSAGNNGRRGRAA